MPLPEKREGEKPGEFIARCMSDPKIHREYPDQKQRTAVCMSKACEGMSYIEAADFQINFEEYGFTEDLTEDNWYCPTEAEYVDDVEWGEQTEEWDVSEARPGLWENIRRKKEREGKNYKPARTEKEGRPTQEQLKRAQSDKPGPKDPRRTPAPKKDQKKGSKKNKPDSAKDGKSKITFSKEVTAQLQNKVKEHNAKGKGSKATLGMLKAVYRRGAGAYSTSHAPKMSRHGWAIARVNAFLKLLRSGRPSNPNYTTDNDLLPKGHPRKSKAEEAEAGFKYQDPKTGEIYEYERKGIYRKNGRVLVPARAAEYQGRKVQLGKPFRTPKGPKKFSVYVKNDKGNVVKVNFGDPNMKIKKSDPARRKSFRARHNCDNPGPRYKARYWSCRKW
jgi:hypothetical protein|tara:strand:- start:7126 stop:8292 length:1167 start_codon:yes stop_codon:yes gene_type:complete